MLHDKSSIIFARGDIHSRQIALTYDCGADRGKAVEILNVLQGHGVLATFFITGQWAENNPDICRKIINEGHEVGNHSYDHPDLTRISMKELVRQATEADKSIYRVTGKHTYPLFRLPFGSYSRRVLDVLGEMGYEYCIHWSRETLDYQQLPADRIVNRIVNNIRNGEIILMNVLGQGTAEASDLAVTELKNQGYEFVTVGSMLSKVFEEIKYLSYRKRNSYPPAE